MQRRGIGKQLVEYCEHQAIERGYGEVCLWVLAENTAAKAFYEKMGYMPDGAEKFLEQLSVTEVRYTKTLFSATNSCNAVK
jgi:ribosomal protein S18 acetylase RimI-like enzyme